MLNVELVGASRIRLNYIKHHNQIESAHNIPKPTLLSPFSSRNVTENITTVWMRLCRFTHLSYSGVFMQRNHKGNLRNESGRLYERRVRHCHLRLRSENDSPYSAGPNL